MNKMQYLQKAWCDMDHYRTYRIHCRTQQCDQGP